MGKANKQRSFTIRLRPDVGDAVDLKTGKQLQTSAMDWSYTLAGIRNWLTDEKSRETQAGRAEEHLTLLGVGSDSLDSLAKAGLLEIEIPYREEAEGWEARIMPWEFVLGLALKSRREGRVLPIVRFLQCEPAPRVLDEAPANVLFMDNAPGPLRDLPSGAGVRAQLTAHLQLNREPDFDHQTLSAVRTRMLTNTPAVVHFSAVDNEQARRLIGERDTNRRDQRDGAFLANAQGGVDFVEAMPLAQALVPAGGGALHLVSIASPGAAARIAPLCVAAGAQAAVGLQVPLDEAENAEFFTTFYQNWRLSGWKLLAAFIAGSERLYRDLGVFPGTGPVLWSAHSLLAGAGDVQAESYSELARKAREEKQTPLGTGTGGDGELLEVSAKPLEKLNYSLLHNNQNLFSDFRIVPKRLGTVTGVSVEVRLHLGMEDIRYRGLYALSETLDLAPVVRIPLTSEMARSLRDTVNTSLTVAVAVHGRDLYCKSFRVALLPVDEWQDSKEQRKWLPSFVLPGDPAVRTLVDRAQKYLRVLADDPSAGFDGYQSTRPDAREPDLGVDNQVQALWWALINDTRLAYINPPPTFSERSQRLRSPSDVLQAGRGTCIDLTLLLAACLEYVEIHPVVILLHGHAFPAYLRSAAAFERLSAISRVTPSEVVAKPSMEGPDTSFAPETPWILGNRFYSRILELVRDGDLIPLESVWLTRHKGFWEAVDEGMLNLRSKSDFEWLIDIHGARRTVTPLPVGGNTHE
ncbi:MAG: hypothetical protein KDH88_14370 [Chromatiales bacterium]|nr:hypothetical protein [Chromatiales bacterium]